MRKNISITILLLLLVTSGFYIKRLRFQNNIISDKEIECQYSLKYFDFHYKKEDKTADVLMLGNSLIRHGNWDSLLNRSDVVNRGISGDQLKCICERLKYVVLLHPKICFIEGGINDLPGKDISTLVNFYQKIILYLKDNKIIPVINMVVQISPKAAITWSFRKDYSFINRQIEKLNYQLQTLAIKEGVNYIDLNPMLSSGGQLNEKYTTDGVHFTPAAYSVWVEEIKKILAKYQI